MTSPVAGGTRRSRHAAFGLTIDSQLPLPELRAADGAREADVDVALGTVPEAPPPSGRLEVVATAGEVRGWIPLVGAFRVRAGRSIVLEPMPGADERALRLAILGPLLGVALAQRGRLVLHASTVAIDGVAVAFVGPSGRGKSTLAAALARRGHPLIADDLTVIATEEGAPRVHAGFARVKLWPDSVAALDHDVDALPVLHPLRTKRSLSLDSVRADVVPLARCYLLHDGDDAVAELPPVEATLSLVASTYQAAWLHDLGAAGTNVVQCAAVARSGVVRRLLRRRAFDALDDAARLIEADVAETTVWDAAAQARATWKLKSPSRVAP